MALAYVGGTSGTGTTATYTVSLTGLTGGLASAPAEGDVVVVFSGFGNTASSAPGISGNNSGAYNVATAAQHVNDTWDTEFGSFYMVMGTTPDTSLTASRTDNAAYGGATNVHVWRGVDTASPFIGAAIASGFNGNVIDAPSYDPAVADAIVIAGGAGTLGAGASAHTAMPGAANLLLTTGTGTTSDISLVMGSYSYAGVAIDPDACTGATADKAASWAGVTLAIRPRVVNNYVLDITTATFAVTGFSLDLTYLPAAQHYELIVTPSSLALTTADIYSYAAKVLPTTAATLSVDFASSVTLFDAVASIVPAAFSVTSADLNLTLAVAAAAYTLEITPGSLGITTSAVSAIKTSTIAATATSLSITLSNLAATKASNITVTSGSLILATVPLTLAGDFLLQQLPGSYAVDTNSLALELVYNLAQLPGSYTLAGSPFTLLRTGVVWPPQADVRFGIEYGPTGSEYVGAYAAVTRLDISTGALVRPIGDTLCITL